MSNPYASGAMPPPAHILASSNLGRWMRELGLETYDELHRYSIANMETFIENALRKLGIRFRNHTTGFWTCRAAWSIPYGSRAPG